MYSVNQEGQYFKDELSLYMSQSLIKGFFLSTDITKHDFMCISFYRW